MTYPEHSGFEFNRNGHSNRRDRDAHPQVLCVGFDFHDNRMQFHLAGDEYIREAHVFDAALDVDLVAGLDPHDALRLGMEYERARKAEKAAEVIDCELGVADE